MGPSRRRVACLPIAALTLAAGLLNTPLPAAAHAIESSLERVTSLNNQLLLQSFFSNGEPVQAAVVRLIPPIGSAIEVGRTDTTGQLRFKLPLQAGADWEVQVDRGAGHRDYLELPTAANGPQARRGATPLSAWLQPTSAGISLTLLGLCGLGLLGLRRRAG